MKLNLKALYIASRDARTPTTARYLSIAVVAYALSPIDLIPDFIPVLGYVDDLILLPIGIYCAIKQIPSHLWQTYHHLAEQTAIKLPINRSMAIFVILIWLILASVITYAYLT